MPSLRADTSLGVCKMTSQAHMMTRRTLLKGVGVTMALPWLESLPVWGTNPAAGTAASAPPKRLAVLFMGNGISPPNWWARGSGADMQLSRSLEPLAALRPRLNVVSGLFNRNATG